ncbi:MAG: NUDIX hydrolase [Anaerolineales bacterium]|nr:NUDIX hydrolase [Anaerolineales bacterium]
MKVLADEVQLPDGRVVQDYMRIEAPDSVMIVPVNNQGQVGMIRSYKRGLDEVDIQPPAGMIENGEEALLTAKRELREECGCTANAWEHLGTYVLGGNFGGGWVHLFLAEQARIVAKPDPGDLEEMEVLWIAQDDLKTRWLRGDFRQIASAAAIGLALMHINRGDPRRNNGG